MHPAAKLLIVATGLFLLPVAITTALNWNDVRPYLLADPHTAEGRALYFYGPL